MAPHQTANYCQNANKQNVYSITAYGALPLEGGRSGRIRTWDLSVFGRNGLAYGAFRISILGWLSTPRITMALS